MPGSALHVVDHPLVRNALAQLRDRRTGADRFRELTERLAMLLAWDALAAGLAEDDKTVETPLESTGARRLREENLIVIPVLRAGLGMVPGILRLVPGARVGHIGMERNEETLEPSSYYAKLPQCRTEDATALVVDPMLGTGGTASATLGYLKAWGARDIRLICIVASPEGVQRMTEDHPEAPVFAAALDRCLNEHGYILPGLGDAGDRLFGTE